ncbi:hypothetical protein V6N13_106383 [Hibiscus sabdariffa]
MVDTGSVEAVLKSPGTRGFDLAEFPPLGDGQIGVTVAGGNAIDSGKSVWNLLDQSLQFFPPVTTNGRARVQPPKEVLSNGAKQWDNTLVGNFLGKSPNLSVFQKTVDRLWGRESSVQICFLAPSVYMINFPSRRVRDWVLESGPWHIQQKAIILRRWMLGLKFDVLQLDSAPVWVKLWHVPLELFFQQGLGYVVSAIGKPLYTDRATALKQQLEFAKIFIEIDATETIPNSVLVELDEGLTVEITVELVWSPPRCGHCSIFGHSEDNCSKKKIVEDSVAKVDGGQENCDAKMDDGRATNGDAKVGLSCDAEGSMGVDSHVSIVEGQDDRMVSPRKEVKESKGPKKKSQGKGSQKVKVNKEMWSEN